MKKKEKCSRELRNELFTRYPALATCQNEIDEAFAALKSSYQHGGQLLVAGNGGSAADAEHIVGELMKSFLFNREIDREFEARLTAAFGEDGVQLAGKLEGAIPTIPLTSMPALTSAFTNDVDGAVSFAQMLYGFGRKDDVFIGISTSGNSRNILYALMTAKAKNILTIGLTGKDGGKMKNMCDICICVPETETFKIQEYHLPVYHTLCAMLEADCFDEKS